MVSVSKLAGTYENSFCSAVAKLFVKSAVSSRIPRLSCETRAHLRVGLRNELDEAALHDAPRRQSRRFGELRLGAEVGDDPDDVPQVWQFWVGALWRRTAATEAAGRRSGAGTS